jgi:hypothetical protein
VVGTRPLENHKLLRALKNIEENTLTIEQLVMANS